MTYLQTPPARYRYGAGIIEEFRPDGSIARRVWERPSVRPEPAVRLEPVAPDDDGLLAVAFIGVLLAVGMLLGWAT